MEKKNTFCGDESFKSAINFNLNDDRTSLKLIKQVVIVKKACALSNHQTKLLNTEKKEMIVMACDLIISAITKKLCDLSLAPQDITIIDSFITHPLQGGAGTSTNMNVNEVITNLALTEQGHSMYDYSILHPINDVNLSQSTNDVYPSALKIAAIYEIRALADALSRLQQSLQEKETQFSDVLKLGRTQLMDALPITLGQEFGAYARAISRDRWRIYKGEERLRELNIGGTAVGTGMNAPLMYIYGVTDQLQRLTGLGLSRSDLLIDSTQNMDVFVEVSGLLKALATNLIKISNDLRLMASGPRGGFGEINLEAHQAGSSIMPGKVNPVICEMINQIAFKVIGADSTITLAAASGQLELNPYGPLIAHELLKSLELLTKGIDIFNNKCIQTITANKEHCQQLALSSLSIGAAFIDSLGYDKVAEISKQALDSGLTIKDIILNEKLLSFTEVTNILNIHQLTQPGIPG